MNLSNFFGNYWPFRDVSLSMTSLQQGKTIAAFSLDTIMGHIRLIEVIFIGLVATAIAIPGNAHARAGTLNSPSIAMPTGLDGKPDPVSAGMLAALRKSSGQFVEGGYVNAVTTMQFQGKWKHLGRLIKDLSEVEGAETSLTISRAKPFIIEDSADAIPPANVIHWTITHNGWGSPNHISITVNLPPSDDDDDSLSLPAILGKAPKSAAK